MTEEAPRPKPRNPNVTPARKRHVVTDGKYACECWRFVVISTGQDGTMRLYPGYRSCEATIRRPNKRGGLQLARGHNMRLIDRACAAQVEGLDCAVLPPPGEAGAWCPTDPYGALREARVAMPDVWREKYETRARRDRERRANAEQKRKNSFHKAQDKRMREML